MNQSRVNHECLLLLCFAVLALLACCPQITNPNTDRAAPRSFSLAATPSDATTFTRSTAPFFIAPLSTCSHALQRLGVLPILHCARGSSPTRCCIDVQSSQFSWILVQQRASPSLACCRSLLALAHCFQLVLHRDHAIGPLVSPVITRSCPETIALCIPDDTPSISPLLPHRHRHRHRQLTALPQRSSSAGIGSFWPPHYCCC